MRGKNLAEYTSRLKVSPGSNRVKLGGRREADETRSTSLSFAGYPRQPRGDPLLPLEEQTNKRRRRVLYIGRFGDVAVLCFVFDSLRLFVP